MKRAVNDSVLRRVSFCIINRHSIDIGTFTIQVLLDAVQAAQNEEFAQYFPNMTKGKPESKVPPINQFDCSRSERLLDLEPTNETHTA